jgi:outer membrane protein OmpA-like peptidoglycan-associated protein
MRFLHYFLFSLILVSAVFPVTGQSDEAGQVEMADVIYNFGAKKDALEQYLNVLQINPDNVRANLMAGICYLETINKELSVNYLIKAYQLNPNIRYDILYKIGKGYQLGLKFDEAVKYFQLFKEKLVKQPGYRGTETVSKKEVDKAIQECLNGKEFVSNPINYSIKNIGGSINTEFPEFAPVINSQETVMAFTARREDNIVLDKDVDNEFFEDIYICFKESDGSWGKAKNIGEKVNTKTHDSCLGFSPDGQTLFVYRDENGGDIYHCSLKNDGNWSTPVPLEKTINSSYTESSLAFSSDGKTMFFCSNRVGGYGGLDIYYSLKDRSGHWGVPKNLGNVINTEYNDESPFLEFDGKTLFFSSKGHKGIGGYDIFMSEYDSTLKQWKEPINMGYPLNTPDDDIYFVKYAKNKSGYYASVRNDCIGEKDIFSVDIDLTYDELNMMHSLKMGNIYMADKSSGDTEYSKTKDEENKEVILKEVTAFVRIKDEFSGKPLDVNIDIKDPENNVLIHNEKVEAGLYKFSYLSKTEKTFNVSVGREGYMFQIVNVDVPACGPEPGEFTKEIAMSEVRIGLKSILGHIYFESNSAKVRIESYPELNNLEKFLRTNPSYKVKISGHSDNVGDDNYNKQLSFERANAIVEFLKRKKIDKDRLSCLGLGEDHPIATNTTEEGRRMNRRVEIEIVGRHIVQQ